MKYYFVKALEYCVLWPPAFLTRKCLRSHATGRHFGCAPEVLFSFLIRTHQQAAILLSLMQLPALEDMIESKPEWTPYSPIKTLSNANNQNYNCRINTSSSREPQVLMYSWKRRIAKDKTGKDSSSLVDKSPINRQQKGDTYWDSSLKMYPKLSRNLFLHK